MALIDEILNSQVIDGRVTSQSDGENVTCLQKIVAIDKYLKRTNENVNNYYQTTEIKLGNLSDKINTETDERQRGDSELLAKINTETSERQRNDSELLAKINAETAERQRNDSELLAKINAIESTTPGGTTPGGTGYVQGTINGGGFYELDIDYPVLNLYLHSEQLADTTELSKVEMYNKSSSGSTLLKTLELNSFAYSRITLSRFVKTFYEWFNYIYISGNEPQTTASSVTNDVNLIKIVVPEGRKILFIANKEGV